MDGSVDIKKHNRLGILAAGTVSLLFLGTMYGWSIFIDPIEASFGWNRAQVTLAYSLANVTMGVGAIFDSYFSRKHGARRSALVAIFIFAIGYIATSSIGFLKFPDLLSLAILYIFYGVFVGFGIGMCYSEWLAIIMGWFGNKKGTASGILLMGFGIGGLFMAETGSALMQNGVKWNGIFMLIGLIGGSVLLLMWFLSFREPPKNNKPGSSVEPEDSKHDYNCKKMMKTFLFWAFVLWKLIILGTGAAIVGQAAEVAKEAGTGLTVASLCVSALSLGNGIGRILTGFLIDKIGINKTMSLLSLILTIVLIGLGMCLKVTIPLIIIVLLFFVFGIVFGGGNTMAPNYIQYAFGSLFFRENNGVNNITSFIGALVASSAISIIRTNSGSYSIFIFAMIIFAAVSIVLAIILQKFEKREFGILK